MRSWLIALVLLSVPARAAPNLVANGDFEQPVVPPGVDWTWFLPAQVPGWTISITGDDGGPPGPDLEYWTPLMPGAPYSGNQYVELDGYDPTRVEQSVPTTVGGVYRLSYAWRPRADAHDTHRMEVWLDGALLALHLGSTVAGSVWTHETGLFTATQSSTTIACEETGPDDQLGMLLDAVSITLEEIQVAIDIKPGSFPNSISIDGHGTIPVAILGSATFDVTTIDLSTLTFAGLALRLRGRGVPQCSVEDVSGDFSAAAEGAPDGYPDLVCHFVDDPALWSPAGGTAEITGLLLSGTSITGSDSIHIVPR